MTTINYLTGQVKFDKPNAPAKTNPIKQVVDVMRKVDVKSPDATKNEKSIVDKSGKRINLNDEDVRYDHFKGAFVKKSDKKG